MDRFDEYIVQGDTIELLVSLWIDDVQQDITGATVYYTVKQNRSDTDAQAKILVSGTASGATYLVSVDSDSLSPGAYYHELRIRLPTGKMWSRQGKLYVEKSIRENI